MSLRSPTSNEIALTVALSHRNGRGDFLIQDVPDVNPRPLAGEGRVRVLCPLSVFSKEVTKSTKFRSQIYSDLRVLRASFENTRGWMAYSGS